MAIVAILMGSVPSILDWVNNPPSVSLSSVVKTFNESQEMRIRPESVTGDDIVASINAELPNLVEAERMKKVLRRIAKKRRVPLDTKIECIPVLPADLLAKNQMVVSLSFLAHTKNRRVTIPIRSNPTTK